MQLRAIPVAAVFIAVTGQVSLAPLAMALDKNGYYDASDNPLLGTWLLSGQVINPNLPTTCGIDRMAFTPTTSELFTDGGGHSKTKAQFIPRGPNMVTVNGGLTLKLIDHDHIMQDEIPRCIWQRGPIDGSTPLLDQRYQAMAAKLPGAAASAPSTAGAAQPTPATTTPELERAMKDLDQAIQELEQQTAAPGPAKP